MIYRTPLYRLWARIAVRLGLPHVHTEDCGRFE